MIVTINVLKVLQVFREEPKKKRRGLEIMKATQMGTGSFYPVLARLEEAGWIESGWDAPRKGDRKVRRWYKITDEGQIEASAVIHEIATMLGLQ